MGSNDKIAATFHPWTDAELITAARAWPADHIDQAIILDLADALERHQGEFNPGLADLLSRKSVFEESPDKGDLSGPKMSAIQGAPE